MSGEIHHLHSFRLASDAPLPEAADLAVVAQISGTFIDKMTETPVEAVSIADSAGLFPFGEPAAFFDLDKGTVVIEYTDGTAAKFTQPEAFERLQATDLLAAESIDFYFSNLKDTSAVDALIAEIDAHEAQVAAEANPPQRKSGVVSLVPTQPGG